MDNSLYTVVFEDKSRLEMGILVDLDNTGRDRIYIPEIDTVVAVNTNDLAYMYHLARLLYDKSVYYVAHADSVYPVISKTQKLILTVYIDENEDSDLKRVHDYDPAGNWYDTMSRMCNYMHLIIMSHEQATSIQFKINYVDSSGLSTVVCQVGFFSDYYRQDLWTDQQEKDHRVDVAKAKRIIRRHLPSENQVSDKSKYMYVVLAKIYIVLESYLKTFK